MSPGASANDSSTSSHGDVVSVLVTGAAGFIGSHLCDRLLAEGHRVWGLDNFDDFYDPARKRENLRGAVDHPSMHLVEGDIRDQVLLDGLMSDVELDAVVHLAARAGIRPSIENAHLTYDVNVQGTLTLLEGLRRHSVPALLFGSSSAVYGNDADVPNEEDDPADRPLSAYAASKRAAEMLCHIYHHLHGLTVHCLRLSSVFGPRERPDLTVQELARLMEEGVPVELDREGPETRDYVHVDDAVDGIVLSLSRAGRRNGEKPEYEVINVGGSEAVGQGELVRKLSDAMGVSSELSQQSSDGKEEAAPAVSSVEKAAKLLGYRPAVSLEDGLAEFSRWFRESRSREGESSANNPAVGRGAG